MARMAEGCMYGLDNTDRIVPERLVSFGLDMTACMDLT